MIDNISYKIINELRHDGRMSNAMLARKLGVSVITVAKKINSMIEKGEIVIKAIPNPVNMGYTFQAFIGLSAEPGKISSICEQLKKNNRVHMLSTCLGRFDILALVFFKETANLQDFLKVTLPRIEGITGIDHYLITEYRIRNGRKFVDLFSGEKPASIDELDHKIIMELIHDGRPNYTDLASRLGVSRPTVSRRVSIMLKENLISILAIPEPSKLGYTANAYALVKTEYSKIDSICNQLIEYPEVHLILRLMNGFDILFGVYSSNLDRLFKFLKNKVSSIEGILKLEIFVCGDFFYFNAGAAFTQSDDKLDRQVI